MPHRLQIRTRSRLAALCFLSLAGCCAALGGAAPSALGAVSPTAGPVGNTPLGPGQVGLGVYANPQGSAVTKCRFLYGPTAAYGSEAPCEPKPPTNAKANLVKGKLKTLTPGAEYHVAFLIATAGGETTTEDATLLAPAAEEPQSCPNEARREETHSTLLPDCRAWEMVSPPDKNGGYVIADSQRTHASEGGDAVAFEALAAFGDAIGTDIATEYLAERSTGPEPGGNGWATHAITPPQESNNGQTAIWTNSAAYEYDLSPDLNRAILADVTPQTEDPSVAASGNLYRRTDLLSPGPGAYDLLSSCPLCEEPGGEPLSPLPLSVQGQELDPKLAWASPDLSHVAFESMQRRLTADTPASPGCDLSTPVSFSETHKLCRVHVFEADGSSVRLAGRVPALPATSCDDQGAPACVPADVSEAGAGTGLSRNLSNNPTQNTISDGSDGHLRLFFTQPTNAAGETSEEAATQSAAEAINRESAGLLYMREDGQRTVQINASERRTPDPPTPAEYLDASADGTRVFFKTQEALTEDATPGDPKLYMYSVAPDAEGHHLTLLSPDGEPADHGEVEGTIGVSDDGRYVYFTASGQLVKGQPTLVVGLGLYLWHDGSLAYVGTSPTSTALKEISTTPPVNWTVTLDQARVTPDGRQLLFTTNRGGEILSTHGGVDYDHGSCPTLPGCREVYLYSAPTDTLTCASCNPAGGPPPPLEFPEMAATAVQENAAATSTTFHRNRAVSVGGRYVFFSTAEQLVPGDTNGVTDAYEYDTRTATPHLLSSGTGEDPSYFLDASADGRDAFFVTAQPLVGWDTDTSYDLYDARVEGGFPEPRPLPAPCNGDSCRPAIAPLSAPPAGGSSSFSGPGNAVSHRGCPKGRRAVKKHGKTRCVRVHGKQPHKRAGANRGGKK